ncbi:hypothetical protein SNE40_021471 [Patella caerulea]|uniref:Corticotropin-releasing factor domain-containing protein n=1 Tax=Patella caerulea TaxID=87958 RepID=A0AAN8GIS9_PATCE
MIRLFLATLTAHVLVTSHAMPPVYVPVPILPDDYIELDRLPNQNSDLDLELKVNLDLYKAMLLTKLSKELPFENLESSSPTEIPSEENEKSQTVSIGKRSNLSINQELKTLARMLVSRNNRRRRDRMFEVRSRLRSLGKRSVRDTNDNEAREFMTLHP